MILKKTVPELAFRMQILEHIQKYWSSLVGISVAKYSFPYDLKNHTLYISVRLPHAAHILNSMKGNIKRSEKTISDIKITNGIPPEYFETRKKISISKEKKSRSKVNNVKISDDEVNELTKDFPENLTSETANALAHLIIFFKKRFQ